MGNPTPPEDIPISNPKGVFREENFELQRIFVRWILKVFAVANIVVLLLVMFCLYLDQSVSSELIRLVRTQPERVDLTYVSDAFPRRITTEVLMALIGATAVQLGTIAYLIAGRIFRATEAD